MLNIKIIFKEMRKRKIISFLLILLSISNGYGQQEAQFTQYLDNMQYYNPAYIGKAKVMNVSAFHRQQWVGIEGAPMTQVLSLHTPIKYESLGVGLSFLNDRIGTLNQSWINADVSYTLRFKKHQGKLSFGLKGGINLVNNDLNSLYAPDDGDLLVTQSISNKVLPNVGFGVYYHSKHFFAGFSVPRIVETSLGTTTLNYLDQRHYYASLGGYFNVNRMLKMRPSMMFKLTENAPFALDASLAFVFYDKFWLGGNYRIDESAGGFFQYQFTNQFKIGYAFDISTSKLFRHNAGTHEIMLSYDFLIRKKSIHSPRYF